jgi:hypothetical protein
LGVGGKTYTTLTEMAMVLELGPLWLSAFAVSEAFGANLSPPDEELDESIESDESEPPEDSPSLGANLSEVAARLATSTGVGSCGSVAAGVSLSSMEGTPSSRMCRSWWRRA